MKLPVISLAILAGQVGAAYDGTWAGTASNFANMYTGIDFQARQFNAAPLLVGYAPWLVKRFLLPIARPRLGGMHLPVSLS